MTPPACRAQSLQSDVCWGDHETEGFFSEGGDIFISNFRIPVHSRKSVRGLTFLLLRRKWSFFAVVFFFLSFFSPPRSIHFTHNTPRVQRNSSTLQKQDNMAGRHSGDGGMRQHDTTTRGLLSSSTTARVLIYTGGRRVVRLFFFRC